MEERRSHKRVSGTYGTSVEVQITVCYMAGAVMARVSSYVPYMQQDKRPTAVPGGRVTNGGLAMQSGRRERKHDGQGWALIDSTLR